MFSPCGAVRGLGCVSSFWGWRVELVAEVRELRVLIRDLGFGSAKAVDSGDLP